MSIRYFPSELEDPDAHRFVRVVEDRGEDPEKQERYTMRLMHDWIFVQVCELPETYRGSIVLPQGESGSNLRVGTVLGYGPGEELPNGIRQPVGVKRGEVVVFHRWNMEHKQGRMLGQFVGKDGALIRARDVLLVLPPGSEEVELT